MITEARFQVLAKALAYLIKQTPMPKSDKAKADRTALLQDLTNAQRPLRVAEPAPSSAPAASSDQTAAESTGPPPLEVRYAEPQRNSDVRPGTVVGVPRQVDPNRSW